MHLKRQATSTAISPEHVMLGRRHDTLNIEGGTIAHGHSIGATGAVLSTRLDVSLITCALSLSRPKGPVEGHAEVEETPIIVAATAQ